MSAPAVDLFATSAPPPARLRLVIVGVPVPKGSTRGFVVQKAGQKPRAIVVPTNKAPARLWAGAIAEAASRAVLEQRGGQVIAGAVRVRVRFVMPRPKSLPKRVTQHTKKPDLDKLTRNVGDALRHVAYEDDASVIEWVTSKEYVLPGQAPCAVIDVEAV